MKKIKSLLLMVVFGLVTCFGGVMGVNAAGEVAVVFADSNLCSAIKTEIDDSLYVAESTDCVTEKTITFVNQAAIDGIVALDLDNSSIVDLGGLEKFTKLNSLYLGYNDIEDISELAGLSNMFSLGLNNNIISDISVLSNLIKLRDLNVSNNAIDDISVVAGMVNLQWFDAGYNQITDLTPIAELSSLDGLYVEENLISVVPDLSKLTNLEVLDMSDNSIYMIKGMANLTRLEAVDFSNNNIRDLTPFAGLTNIYELDVAYNNISDISMLNNLKNLMYFYFSSNHVTDVKVLDDLYENFGYLNEVYAMNNSYTAYILPEGTKALPKIFSQVGISYDELITDNCTVDEDFNVIIDEGVAVGEVATVTIGDGYAEGTTITYNVVETITDEFATEDGSFKLISLEELDENLVLVATNETDDLSLADKTAINEQLKGDSVLIELFDISLQDENSEVVEIGDGQYQIKIKLTEEMKKYKDYTVAYINGAGEVEELFTVTIEGDYLVFTTTHLSLYGVAGVANVANPKTFDASYMYMMMGLVGLGGLSLGLKKFRPIKEN